MNKPNSYFKRLERARYRAQGLCYCGKETPPRGYATCNTCALKRAEYYYRDYYPNMDERPEIPQLPKERREQDPV